MSYEENIRVILQACFSQSKDELIEVAVKAIVAIRPESVIINPSNPLDPWRPNVYPYYEDDKTVPLHKTDKFDPKIGF